MNEKDINKLLSDYNERYKIYGYSPKTLGWYKGKQLLRFDILTSQYDFQNKRILDIGCGFGDLNKVLNEKNYDFHYCGIDLVNDLINEGKKHYTDKEFLIGNFLTYEFDTTFDYGVSSGIFNRKFENDSCNYDFIHDCMKKALELCKDGIAFDFLSDKVDYQYDYTFHSNPAKILEIAYSFSKRIILRNDYMPFEFSVFIFNDDSFEKEDTIFNQYKIENLNQLV